METYDGKKWIAEFLQNRTYGAVLKGGRKEKRTDTINRTRDMHIKKFPELEDMITEAFKYVHMGMGVPSMRSLQFGGEAIEKANARMYNCAFANLTSWNDFHDAFYLLMCGTGFGYSVKSRHVDQLPAIKVTSPYAGKLTYRVDDSKEGWADALRFLLNNPTTEFDYSLIRPAGSLISSGGTASGPGALKETLESVRAILQKAEGRKLTTLEAHDIMCFVANGVVVGGVRRAALICLFDHNDIDMNTAKSGTWWEFAPQRARANNSAVIYLSPSCSNDEIDEQIESIIGFMLDSGSGEPGISLTNNPDWGFNPCHEIALKDGGLCNLTEINLKKCKTIADISNAVHAATVIGTLQASYTKFEVLQPKWTKNATEEALLGVSATGQADNWDLWKKFLSSGAASKVVEINRHVAKLIGINPAHRITTTKPSGSTSAWLGCSSGIHADHDEYYIRHIRMEKTHKIIEAVVNSNYPFVEVDQMDSDKLVIGFPVKTTDGSILKNSETAVQLLERAKFIHDKWIKPGHVVGDNTHNVSLTVEYKDGEKDDIIQWMKDNKEHYAGISFLPRTESIYTQMPFQSITKEEYDSMVVQIQRPIDYVSVDWTGTVDDRMGELACVNGACEIE